MIRSSPPVDDVSVRRRRSVMLLTLLVVLACVLILCVWLITLQRVAFERDQAMAAAMKSNASLAIAFEQQVSRTLRAAEQVAVFVREQYQQKGDDIDLRSWVEEGIIREKIFTIISVVNEHGEVVSSSQSNGPVNYADRDFFIAQRNARDDRLFINPPVLGRVSGRWLIPLSLRMEREDGSFAGVVVLAVSPVDVTRFLQRIDLKSQGLLELSGLDGVVRARRIGQHSEFGLDARPLAWFERRRQQPVGEFYDTGEALDGVSRLVSYRTLSDYPLMVTVATAYAEELEATLQRRTTYLVAALGVTLGVMLFTGLLLILLQRQRAATDALQGSEALFRATFHQAAMGIAHITPEGGILRVNQKFCRMLGRPPERLQGHNIFELSDAASASATRSFLQKQLADCAASDSAELEKTYRRDDGTLLWVCEALGVVRNSLGQAEFLVLVAQDITARKNLEARLSYEAQHDVLTGLANRICFREQLDRVLGLGRSQGRLSAVLYIDLDGFKAINDSYGHVAGDMLLQLVARRLEGCVRSEDTVARFGGDEFGILLTNLNSRHDCEVVARKVLEVLERPFQLGGHVVRISASVGAAMYELHGRDGHELVALADKAMYSAKHAGKNRFCWAVEQV
ncbi:diguanylate cyclase domain-containing protein [Pseudomonas sp. NCCP-436]|uniref:sensor domain-containing diguanylate cyclase n=1 Tax=Pseudomonas sp. NCCP-436 TaxID=2842481 RepID=UPI001C7FC123|nr:diguanylate cyclase [Pseudomonas sp. NCCP-436]GIZ11319.1 diguanylate cyclase [Pseudomonas sp. NCCP-436]